MAKKNKTYWKEIILAIIFLLIFISILNNNNRGEKLKSISISGIGEVVTINNIEPSKIYISGIRATVYFSKTSNPKEIYLSGIDSIAYLCEGIHNPIVETSGINAKSIYRNC